MAKKRKSFVWIFIKSFTDFDAYKSFIQPKFTRAFAYVLVLSLLLSAMVSIFFISSTNPYLNELDQQLSANTPDFTIESGLLDYPDDSTKVLAEIGSKGTLVIIDTAYTGSASKYEEYDTSIILAKESIYLSNPSIKYSVDYSQLLMNSKLNSKNIIDSFIQSKNMIFVLIVISVIFMFLFNYLFYMFLIASIINFIRRMRKKPTGLSPLNQLTAYAMSLPAVLYALWKISGASIIFGDLLFFVLAFFLANKGISSAFSIQDSSNKKDGNKA